MEGGRGGEGGAAEGGEGGRVTEESGAQEQREPGHSVRVG